MSTMFCQCGVSVDTDHDFDAIDIYGNCECQSCRKVVDPYLSFRQALDRWEASVINTHKTLTEGPTGIIREINNIGECHE